jgi:hypothetical protein
LFKFGVQSTICTGQKTGLFAPVTIELLYASHSTSLRFLTLKGLSISASLFVLLFLPHMLIGKVFQRLKEDEMGGACGAHGGGEGCIQHFGWEA